MSVLSGISALGIVMICFTKSLTYKYQEPEEVSIKEQFFRLFNAFREKKMILFSFAMTYLGSSFTFNFGVFPTLMDVDQIPFVFLFYGISSLFGSFFVGKFLDRFGWKVVVIANAAVDIIGYAIVIFGHSTNVTQMYYLSGICFGFGDSALNTFLNWVIMMIYSESPGAAFSALRFFSPVAAGFAFLASNWVSFLPFIIILSVLLVIATTAIFIVDLKFQRFLPTITSEEITVPNQKESSIAYMKLDYQT